MDDRNARGEQPRLGSGRRACAAGCPWARFALAIAVLLLGSALSAQPTATLAVGSGSGFPGDAVEVAVVVACSAPIDALSFGVAHDAARLAIVAATLGSAFPTPPDFVLIQTSPVGGSGVTAAVIVRFDLSQSLAAGVPHEVVLLEYAIAPAAPAPAATSLAAVSTLGSPPVAVVVASGLFEVIPGTTAGGIAILGPDCNGNHVVDAADIAAGTSADCDGNAIPDECDLAAGALDCDLDGLLDVCEADCDLDGIPDPCEIAALPALDCDGSGVLDSCEIAGGLAADCDGNGVPDPCDLAAGAVDCDGNGVLDLCDLAGGAPDCDGNGAIDACDIAAGAPDCDANGAPDACDIAAGGPDCDADGVLDPCEADCDQDGVADPCEILADPAADCDADGLLDACAIAAGSPDCDGDGLLDACEISGGSPDCDGNGVPDACDLAAGGSDCDGSGVLDSCELALPGADANGNGTLDLCESGFRRGDCNGNGIVNIADPLLLLNFVFLDPSLAPCAHACDANADCAVGLLDGVYILQHLFTAGAAPPAPFPGCGLDPTGCALPCLTGCP